LTALRSCCARACGSKEGNPFALLPRAHLHPSKQRKLAGDPALTPWANICRPPSGAGVTQSQTPALSLHCVFEIVCKNKGRTILMFGLWRAIALAANAKAFFYAAFNSQAQWPALPPGRRTRQTNHKYVPPLLSPQQPKEGCRGNRIFRAGVMQSQCVLHRAIRP
jgi:hypothetical protein